MHGSKRRARGTSAGRRFRFGLLGLAAAFALILGQIGLVIANADTSRDRSAGTISDTTIVGGKATSRGSSGSDNVGSGTITTHPSSGATAAAPAPGDGVTICHATASANNPYVQITVDVNGAGANGLQAHLLHTGPIFDPATMTNGDNWGDIIPDHSDPPNNTPITSLNWTAAGQAIWAAGCKVPGAVPGALSIQKTGPAAGTVGTSFSYQITVSNTGGGTVPGVTVSDAVPAGLTVTGVSFTNSGGGSGNCTAQQNVSCAVGDLVAGGSATVTIGVTPTACGTFNNTAGASSSDPFIASVSTNAPVVTTVPCPAGPALSVTKSGPASVTPPDTFSYTVTVTNSGGTDTTATTVTDTVDPAFVVTSVSFTNSGGGSGTCTAQQSVSCNVGVIVANGGTATVTISGNVPAPASGLCPSVSNQASASAQNATTATSNTVTTTVVCTADVTINKSGPASIGQGGTLTYTVTVSNGGIAPAPNVNITDDLDNSLTGVSASITGGSGASCGVGAGNVVTCGFDLAGVNSPTADHVAVITITANAPIGSCPLISNQATGTFGRGTTIPPSGIVTTQVTGCGGPGGGNAGLAITKTADAGSVTAGSPVGFTITVSSAGTADALGVHLSDPLPAVPGLTWSIAGGSGAAMCSIGANVLNCNFGDLPPGTTLSVHVTSPTTADSCAMLHNTATATATNASPVSASASADVACASGIQVLKAGPAQAHVGDTITYTFDVSLIPNSPPLSNVTLTDPICDPLTLVGPSKAGGNQDSVLEAGEVWSYSCTHVVTAADPDPLPNTATATATDPTGGIVSGSGTHLVDIIHPGIDIVKEADPTSGSPGTLITYTYTVTNSGDVDLLNVSVDDNVLGHICDIAVLHAHETVVCVSAFRIPKNAIIVITNVAIAGGTDPLGLEVTAQDDATIDVVLGKTVTPPSGIAFTGSSAVFPLGGLALVLLLLGSGMLWVGRDRDGHASQGSHEG